jgi:hypothetical protein
MKKKKDKLEFDGLDEIVVAPMKDGEPYYNVRAICEYCKKYNKDIEKLTKEELKPFITGIYKRDTK